ncbi:MAG: glycosyltransferase family 39 protein [Candidatus Latescibacteria bacterium]|nr:glycosyltransferase family 39 protein [Candidatus Latescibacterota bacterium]
MTATRRTLWAILLLALALRAGFGLTRQGLADSSDEYHWDHLASVFWQEGILHPDGGTYRPPLYPLMLAGIYQVCGHRPDLVRLWQALLGTATCGLLYGIGRRLGGLRTGLIAAGLGACYPLFVFFTGVLMAETLLVLLTTAALLLALRLESAPTPGNAAALGGILGLAGLCKPVVLVWVPLLLWGWWRRAALGRGRGMCLAVALGAMGLVIAPWTLRNSLLTGRLVPISANAGMNLLIGNEPEAIGIYRQGVDYLGMFMQLTASTTDLVEKERLAIREIGGWILASPWRFARLALLKLAYFWSPLVPDESILRNAISLCSCGPLLVLGLWGTWQLRRRPEAWAVGSLALGLALVHAIFFAHPRFRLPIDAALMGPAALMLERGWTRLHKAKPGENPGDPPG